MVAVKPTEMSCFGTLLCPVIYPTGYETPLWRQTSRSSIFTTNIEMASLVAFLGRPYIRELCSFLLVTLQQQHLRMPRRNSCVENMAYVSVSTDTAEHSPNSQASRVVELGRYPRPALGRTSTLSLDWPRRKAKLC